MIYIKIVWQVKAKRKLLNKIEKLPQEVILLWQSLVKDLELRGYFPGKKWRNFSKLGKNECHCHLNRSYVACWIVLDEKIQIMEVYYVGSRENAPY